MSALSVPAHLVPLLSLFTSHGEAAYPVGGCVRDTLLGTAPHDWDVAVTTPPDVTESLCRAAGLRVVPTGIKHGTVTVLLPVSGDFSDREGAYDPIECTTCRTEGGYSDGRHPDAVTFTGRIADDLSRRDFTVNAMALSQDETGELSVLDLFGGREDLADGIIRCVGDPATRFSEDALRMLRAVRFAVKLNFAIHPATADAIRALAPTLARISRERVSEEFQKILCSPAPERGIKLLQDTELWPCVLPAGVPHEGMIRLSDLPPELPLRLAALLWGQPTDALERNLASLRLSTAVHKAVTLLTQYCEVPYGSTAADARRFRGVWGDMAIPILLVRAAVVRSSDTADLREWGAVLDLLNRVRVSERHGDPVRLSDLAVGGDHLLAMGIPAGKQIRIMLAALLDLVLEDPARNTREYLLAEAARLRGAQ